VDELHRIAANPAGWTAQEVLSALPVHLPPDAPPADLPGWLREVCLVSDAVVNIASSTVLVWWQDGAPTLLPEVLGALRSVGLNDRADLLERARDAVDPRALAAQETGVELSGRVLHVGGPDAVPQERWALFDEVARAWALAEDEGPSTLDALLAHASAGLARG
jgi:hypothetical protein